MIQLELVFVQAVRQAFYVISSPLQISYFFNTIYWKNLSSSLFCSAAFVTLKNKIQLSKLEDLIGFIW